MAAARWTILALQESARSITNPGGDKAQWRGKTENYASSTRRVLDRTIPYAGTGTCLFQFEHWGMTEAKKIHRVHIQFEGLNVYGEFDDRLDRRVKDRAAKFQELLEQGGYFKVPWGGRDYAVEKPTVDTGVTVRCTCSDAYFRWNWWNADEGALFGPRPRPYQRKTRDRPSVNPEHAAGLCKHVVNSMLLLETSGYLKPGSRSYKALSV